eukprot:scaffold28310_cov67-Phaeocystis_antarctica.AAC.4
MRIASEPEKAGKGSSVSSNDTKRTNGTEKLAVSPYAETVAVSLTWSHVAPASTCSPPAPYEAQLASRGSIVTFVRVSKVKSLLVPSSKNTVIVTVALVGREIGLAAALSSGLVSLYLPMLSANDWALGTCTCTGARPLARVTAGQASHAVLTIWPHSVTALLATSTSHRESDRCTCKLAEVDVTLSSSGGTNHVWPSLKSTDASTVPRSPSARKRCRSCTRAAKLALTAHATVAGGVRDQSISVTTADCSATTVTAASTTATEAGVTEIEALEIVTEASPGDEAYTTLPDRVTLPDASRVTRSVTSMSETLASPAPPKTATAVASVCWYSGDAHASDPSMRLSVPSATCTDSCCGNHTVRGTDVLAPPCSDFTSTDAVPPCIMLLVSSTVHGDASPNRPAGTDTALQEKSDDEVVVAMGCDGRSVNCTTVISTATSTPLSTAVLAGSAVAGYASTASTLAACSTCSWPLDCAPPRRPLIWPGWHAVKRPGRESVKHFELEGGHNDAGCEVHREGDELARSLVVHRDLLVQCGEARRLQPKHGGVVRQRQLPRRQRVRGCAGVRAHLDSEALASVHGAGGHRRHHARPAQQWVEGRLLQPDRAGAAARHLGAVVAERHGHARGPIGREPRLRQIHLALADAARCDLQRARAGRRHDAVLVLHLGGDDQRLVDVRVAKGVAHLVRHHHLAAEGVHGGHAGHERRAHHRAHERCAWARNNAVRSTARDESRMGGARPHRAAQSSLPRRVGAEEAEAALVLVGLRGR